MNNYEYTAFWILIYLLALIIAPVLWRYKPKRKMVVRRSCHKIKSVPLTWK